MEKLYELFHFCPYKIQLRLLCEENFCASTFMSMFVMHKKQKKVLTIPMNSEFHLSTVGTNNTKNIQEEKLWIS